MKKILLLTVLCVTCITCAKEDDCGKNLSQNEQNVMDGEISIKVGASIVGDGSLSLSARSVQVNTKNQVVTLTGTVPTKAEKDKVYQLAKNVKCVKSVDNQVRIEGQK